MKEIKSFLTIIILLVSSFLIFSCEEDGNNAKEPLLGFYTISKSTLTAPCTSQNGAATLPAGTDVSDAILNAFLTDIVCASAGDKAIEIAENGKIYFACRVEGKKQDQGSWAINSERTELTLTLLIQGNLVPVKLTGLQESAAKIKGNVAAVPVPPLLLASVEALFSGVTDEAILINFDIELEKLN
tara:strand:+ start:34 stop:591 length:558 start_codon:yes stop_codon:yes gene_type:complete